jgi:DNA repair protein RadA/Sms
MGAAAVANTNGKDDKGKKGAYLEVKNSGVKRGTNILDVPVDPRLRVNAKTGIDWVDEAAGGEYNPGFRPSSVTLFTAVPGGGKTTLAIQMADAVTKSGHVGLYNTREQSLEDIKMMTERLSIQRGFICGEDIMVDDVLAHGTMLMEKNPKKQLFMFFDSLKTLNDGFYKDGAVNSNTPIRVMQKIIAYCKRTYAIAIVIGHVNKAGKFEGKQQLKHDLDAHVHIEFDMNKKSDTYGQRIYSYSKNRCGPISVQGTVLDLGATGLKPSGLFDLDSIGDDD